MESSKPQYRSTLENIDEISPGIYMSNKNAATCSETIEKYGITHVLCVCEIEDKPFEDKGIKYLLFNDLADDTNQDIL